RLRSERVRSDRALWHQRRRGDLAHRRVGPSGHGRRRAAGGGAAPADPARLSRRGRSSRGRRGSPDGEIRVVRRGGPRGTAPHAVRGVTIMAPGGVRLAVPRAGQRRLGSVTVAPEGRRLLRIEARNAETPIERKPPWIKVTARMGPEFTQLRGLVQREGLHTVCQEAGCPNIYECWEDREATFLI